MQIRTKYLLLLVALATTLTAAISIYQFSATSRLTSEFQHRSLERLESSLTDAAIANAVSLSSLTTDSLLEPLFFQDIDGVGNIVQPLLARDEVVQATVFDRNAEVFHTGSDRLEEFGDPAPPEVVEILAADAPRVSVNDNMTIRIVSPIVEDGYVFGVLDVLIDTTFVEQEIAVMQSELVEASEQEIRQQILQLVVVSLFVLLVAGAIATVLAGRLSAPILQLAERAKRISRGDFSIDIGSKRSDELGDLANAFDDMSRALSETMISRSELQISLEVQTRELREAHENLLVVESDRREVLNEIGDDLREPIKNLESDAEHALRNHDSAIELRHSMGQLLLRIRDVGRLLEDMRFASRSDQPRKAARRHTN